MVSNTAINAIKTLATSEATRHVAKQILSDVIKNAFGYPDECMPNDYMAERSSKQSSEQTRG